MATDEKLNIYFDTEFTGLDRDTDLISIGLSTNDGTWFYGELTDYDHSKIDRWLQDHVINNLLLDDYPKIYTEELHMPSAPGHYHIKIKGDKAYIREELLKWLENESKLAGGKQIQMISDCYAYDWMLFIDLICEDGKALSLPKFIYYIPLDLSTMLSDHGYDPDVSREAFAAKKYSEKINYIKSCNVFNNTYKNIKHNSLWDAFIIVICHHRLTHENE